MHDNDEGGYYKDSEEFDPIPPPPCPQCGGPLEWPRSLGNTIHKRCRACGWWQVRVPAKDDPPPE